MQQNTKLLLLFICFLWACESSSESAPEENLAEASVARQQAVEIQTVPVRRAAFPLQVKTNGRIRARRQVELKMPVGGQIETFQLETGRRVAKGDLLIALDDTDKQLELEQYQFSLDDAEVAKADMLISNGGEANVDSSVSAQRLEFINKLSGYNKARHALQIARRELEKTKLQAPFGGIIANVQVRSEDLLSAGQPLCTLIDPQSFEVEFSLIEQEAVRVRSGQTVQFYALAAPERHYTARISAINPMVNEQGLVQLYAKVANPGTPLFEGMQVAVSIEQRVPDQLIVPREALVLRSGRTVVFTHDTEANLAKWNYVTVAYENDAEVAISEGLEAGQQVIISGNLNLDHDARVQLIPQ
ncbi:MAG TPA: efflux RND transporter periplasmic adaptor subunit [Saprospiraceae bacterium]|nr:efflux RND transporter periplasmic adaptor subunit [Saprospiraceae bacterium]